MGGPLAGYQGQGTEKGKGQLLRGCALKEVNRLKESKTSRNEGTMLNFTFSETDYRVVTKVTRNDEPNSRLDTAGGSHMTACDEKKSGTGGSKLGTAAFKIYYEYEYGKIVNNYKK